MISSKKSIHKIFVALSLSMLCLASCEVDADITLSAFSKPDIPENLAISNITASSIAVQWNAADLEEGVERYLIYQNNIQVAVNSDTSYMAIGLEPESEHTFSVRAINIADKISDFSMEVSVKTRAEETIVPNPEEFMPVPKEDEEEVAPNVVRVLVFSKTSGFRHTSIAKGIATLHTLGAENNFEVTATENATDFNSVNLSSYKSVIFLNTTGDVLDTTQQIAFESYIQAGGSYMGVHAATDTEYEWAWYGQLVGAYFDGHPEIQIATMNVIDNTHQSTEHLSSDWTRTDEWYNFRDINSNINVLLNLDETSYQGGANGENHPIAWYHEFDGGRSFYTGGGHSITSYDEPDFKQHLLGGILYCLGQD